MSFKDDIDNLADRVRDAGHEYRTLINNTKSQVEDLIAFRNQAGESDEKSEQLLDALGALDEAFSTANTHMNITDEVLQKLQAVLG